MNPNRKAFLDMIAVSEGTSTHKNTRNDGYDIIVGGSTFNDYSKHPRKLIPLPKLGIKSSAAGRYQIIKGTYDGLSKTLGLNDFSPETQDAMAIELIRECGALPFIDEGMIAEAIKKCRHVWASLPNAGYGQRENKLSTLLAAYKNAGGAVVA